MKNITGQEILDRNIGKKKGKLFGKLSTAKKYAKGKSIFKTGSGAYYVE